jgi:hypothetical protein
LIASHPSLNDTPLLASSSEYQWLKYFLTLTISSFTVLPSAAARSLPSDGLTPQVVLCLH